MIQSKHHVQMKLKPSQRPKFKLVHKQQQFMLKSQAAIYENSLGLFRANPKNGNIIQKNENVYSFL